ncbi:hypothetical protein KEM55_002851, partial [Ascosphaera atra]
MSTSERSWPWPFLGPPPPLSVLLGEHDASAMNVSAPFGQYNVPLSDRVIKHIPPPQARFTLSFDKPMVELRLTPNPKSNESIKYMTSPRDVRNSEEQGHDSQRSAVLKKKPNRKDKLIDHGSPQPKSKFSGSGAEETAGHGLLAQDLDIVEGMKYNTALTIFFVPYILAEVPSNILMKKLKPNVWLSGCMFLFGLVTCLQGLVQNWGGLMATRFFLGMFESGMFPGCFYLMGTWYSRAEAQKRFSFFFCSTTLAGAFGGLLASAIGLLQGQRGYNGWRWVFIIEGAATAVIGIILYFLIPGFPEEVKWLKDDQKDFLRAKLARDVGKAGHEESIKLKDVFAVIKDYNIWIGAFMYFGLIVPGY